MIEVQQYCRLAAGVAGKNLTAFHIQTDPSNPSCNRRTVIGEVTFGENNGEIWQGIE